MAAWTLSEGVICLERWDRVRLEREWGVEYMEGGRIRRFLRWSPESYCDRSVRITGKEGLDVMMMGMRGSLVAEWFRVRAYADRGLKSRETMGITESRVGAGGRVLGLRERVRKGFLDRVGSLRVLCEMLDIRKNTITLYVTKRF